MRQLKPLIILAALIVAVTMWQRHDATPVGAATPASGVDSTLPPPAPQTPNEHAAFLPTQARAMVQRIERGGPFEHDQDGSVFGNREGLLPRQPRGYYHEYTVETPGLRTRGARRIITGGTPPQIWYYTDDHYRSFRRFEMTR